MYASNAYTHSHTHTLYRLVDDNHPMHEYMTDIAMAGSKYGMSSQAAGAKMKIYRFATNQIERYD